VNGENVDENRNKTENQKVLQTKTGFVMPMNWAVQGKCSVLDSEASVGRHFSKRKRGQIYQQFCPKIDLLMTTLQLRDEIDPRH
jgi:hypothetical protein